MMIDIKEIKSNYPEILSLDQVRSILHISKRKAAWLLQNGHIKCHIGEKKTRQYAVPRSELIKYIVKCSKGTAPSIPMGIFSTKKHPQKFTEENVYICQTTITELKIKLRAEWSEKPTVLTTAQAAMLVGCENSSIRRWMYKDDGLRYLRAQNGIYTTKEWLIDYMAHYLKENPYRFGITL